MPCQGRASASVGGDPGQRGVSGGIEGADGAELGAVVVADLDSVADRGDRRVGQLGLVRLEQLQPVAQRVEVLLHLLNGGLGLANHAGAGLERVLQRDQGSRRLLGDRQAGESLLDLAQLAGDVREAVGDHVGDRVVVALDVHPELRLEELGDLRPDLRADAVVDSLINCRPPEGPVLLEQVTRPGVAVAGQHVAGLELDPHLAGAQQAEHARLNDIARIAVGRRAEVGEQAGAADALVGLDLLADLARHQACAGRVVAAVVELEDFEVVDQLGDGPDRFFSIRGMSSPGVRLVVMKYGYTSGSTRVPAATSAFKNDPPMSPGLRGFDRKKIVPAMNASVTADCRRFSSSSLRSFSWSSRWRRAVGSDSRRASKRLIIARDLPSSRPTSSTGARAPATHTRRPCSSCSPLRLIHALSLRSSLVTKRKSTVITASSRGSARIASWRWPSP
jgi:hypothetical protein